MILNHVTTNPVTEGRNKHIDIKWHGPYLGTCIRSRPTFPVHFNHFSAQVLILRPTALPLLHRTLVLGMGAGANSGHHNPYPW